MTIAVLALLIWVWLLACRGAFWRTGPFLPPCPPGEWSPVDVVVPARDEADLIAASVGSLLAQEYRGPLRVVLVDDGSGDGTGAIARGLAGRHALKIIDGVARPRGWAGKTWAMHQGVAETDAPFVMLTDADIVHAPNHVASMVAQADATGADMVSEMVALHCESLAERALIPAFVYFFALLYPFAWVNDGLRATAAAAGGSVLIRRAALARIGGIAAISGALIDDVALARAVKRGGRIWLGHSVLARSIRPYPAFADIWRMVSRSAYVQLGFSPVLLLGTVIGMALVFLAPPASVLFGGSWAMRIVGFAGWALMSVSFVPTLRRFRCALAWSPALPLIACFYIAATIGAAVSHYRGNGVAWKQRTYTERRA